MTRGARFQIWIGPRAEEDLDALTRRQQTTVLDAIEAQLAHQPQAKMRNRRELREMVFPPDFEPPVWQLRVGDLRVFYDVDPAELTVSVRRIRPKPASLTTEDVLE